MNRAAFLDRDGTINVDKPFYIHRVEDFEFINGVMKSLEQLSLTDYKIIILTNQAGVSKGHHRESDLKRLHSFMLETFEDYDVRINGIYYCPHAPDDGCNCRKPKLGMLEKAVEEHDIDLKKSYIIGDKTCDIKLGNDAGCKTILVETGEGGKDNLYNVLPDFYVKDLNEAIGLILKNEDK